MIDSHRIKCRRAIVICINSEEAKQLVQNLSQKKVMKRCICAIVIQDLLSDLCLFEKQIKQFGDKRPQQQLLYVSDLNRCREPEGLVRFLKEIFSPFGTILSIFVCADNDGYAFPEGVIKFAYLSEAFAAELAFDQYVVGKERLSVTAHHNILLSQCDLRIRLRNAQCCNNADFDIIQESPLLSDYSNYALNNISLNTDSQSFNCTDILQGPGQEDNIDSNRNITAHLNKLDISYSKTKLFNSKLDMLLTKNKKNISNSIKNMDTLKHCTPSNDSVLMSNNNLPHHNTNNNNNTMDIVKTTVIAKNTDEELSFCCVSQNNPANYLKASPNQDVKKCPETGSNSGSYYTCKHDYQDYLSFHSNSNLSPNKTVLSNIEKSFDKNNTLTHQQPMSLKSEVVSSIFEGNLLEINMVWMFFFIIF